MLFTRSLRVTCVYRSRSQSVSPASRADSCPLYPPVTNVDAVRSSNVIGSKNTIAGELPPCEWRCSALGNSLNFFLIFVQEDVLRMR